MKKQLAFLFCILFAASNLPAQLPQKKLQVTYIANEGFMLKTDRHKILIDALFSDGYGYFARPSDETMQKILSFQSPFDSINFCLLTHYHKDHCEPKLISSYLKKRPDVKLVTNKPALVFIDGDQFGFIKLRKQFCELTPAENSHVSQTVNQITINSLGIKHMSFYQDSVNVEEYMFNVAYYFEMDGFTIFHSGDIKNEELKTYLSNPGNRIEKTDVAFVYYEMLNNGTSDLEYLLQTLHPRYLIVMHIPPSMSDKWATKAEKLRTVFPNLIVFGKELETKTID